MLFRLDSCILFVFLFLISCIKKESRPEKTIVYSTDNLKMSLSDQGDGDTTLFFIHGWCINKEYWSDQIMQFKDRYRCVAIDLPGFGESDKSRSDYHFEQYAQDITTSIDSLKLKNVMVIGHSMSGQILLDIADNPAVIGIIGVDNLHNANTTYDTGRANAVDQYYTYFEANYDTVAINEMGKFLFQPSTPDSVKNRVLQDVLNTDHRLSINVLRAMEVHAQKEQLLMQKLRLPLHLVNSDVQPVQLDSLNKYCAKGAKVFYVHNTGHYPMNEKPDEFNKALEMAIKAK